MKLRIREDLELKYWAPVLFTSLGFMWIVSFAFGIFLILSLPVSVYLLYLIGTDNLEFTKIDEEE